MSAKIVVPELGESVVEATVGHWLKKEGERVLAGDVLVELETEKIDLEVSAERDGVLARIERREGENVKIGDVLGQIEEAAPDGDHVLKTPKQTPEAKTSLPSKEERETPAAQKSTPSRKATPLARRIAEEHGVDLDRVPFGDAAGRVRQQDVKTYLQSKATGAGTPSGVAVSKTSAVAPEADLPASLPKPPLDAQTKSEERVRMSRRRLTIARRLVEAQHTAAMLTTFNEIDMSAVKQLRERWKENFKERYGVGLGISSFFVKASVAALREFPRLNAEIQGNEMVLKRYYDIGVAIGAEEGLVVPVLRGADRLSFAEIELAIKEFVRKSQSGELALEDLRGGTFTITNGGVFGSLLSTPILNPPQSGILGLHKIQDRAVPVEGRVEIRPMMYVALSYDHRIVDGREAVQFLVQLKLLVENPANLLFEA